MNSPSILLHLRDVLLLPFTVTVIVPWQIIRREASFIPDHILLKIAGALVLLCGLSLLIFTIFLFGTKGKGTLAPWAAPQKLVVEGPYRYCRNPMISGVFFILIGESMFFHSTRVLIWAGIFFLINTCYFMLKEEPDLLKRFGNDYAEYKKQVPRWIPRIKPYREQ